MHDEIFYKECFECDRQRQYEVQGVKDNYYQCRIKKLIYKEIHNAEEKCKYFKRREHG